jgi:hypothetical protein
VEDSGQQTIALSGIDDGNNGLDQDIAITASSSDVSIIPHPTINYIPNGTSGSLSYTPLSNANGTVTVTVTVTDDGGTENGGINTTVISFEVTINPVNDPPVAGAGPNVMTTAGLQVTLDGSGSYDPEGDSLYFSWIAPEGIALADSTAMDQTFITPDACGTINYIFSLTVSDGLLDSPPDTVVITVSPASTTIYAAGNPVVCPGIPVQLLAPAGY